MFIEVNGRILDKRKYKSDILLLKRLVDYELKDSLKSYGFEKKEDYFVHSQYGLKLKLIFKELEQKPL
ncbi:MAG: hypothetical protein WC758_03400 [Candidatus Woesearchaeota archaeon]